MYFKTKPNIYLVNDDGSQIENIPEVNERRCVPELGACLDLCNSTAEDPKRIYYNASDDLFGAQKLIDVIQTQCADTKINQLNLTKLPNGER